MTPRVDVLVPCYNYARFLPQCVASVLSQQGVDVRVLIIDDASTDNSADVGAELARQDARVEFVRHPVNKGHIATYNEGIEWVDGTYWMLLSADDMLLPGALRRATDVMERHPNVGLTYGRAFLLRPHGEVPDSEDVQLGEHHLMTGLEYIAY